MKNKYPYRFKTEQEFIDEHGSNWRHCVLWNYEGFMDYLLGSIIEISDDKILFPIFINNQSSESINIYSTWCINRNMLTKNITIPDYKPKGKIKRTL